MRNDEGGRWREGRYLFDFELGGNDGVEGNVDAEVEVGSGDSGNGAEGNGEGGEEGLVNEDDVLREGGRLDAEALLRASVKDGLGICTTEFGPLFVIRVNENGFLEGGGKGLDAREKRNVDKSGRLKVDGRIDLDFMEVIFVDVAKGGEWFAGVGEGEGMNVFRKGEEVGKDWDCVHTSQLKGLEFGSYVKVLGDGGDVVVAGKTGMIFVTTGGEFVSTLERKTHCGVVRAIDGIDEDGHGFVTGADDGLLNEWDIRENNIVGTMGGRCDIKSMKAGGPGSWYVAAAGNSGVFVWDRRTRECVWSHEQHDAIAIWALAFCGNHLIWSRNDRALNVLNCSNAEVGNV